MEDVHGIVFAVSWEMKFIGRGCFDIKVLLARGMLFFCCSIASAQVIYSNSFNGGAVTINGTAPTVANNIGGSSSNAVWIFTYTNALDGGWLANGSIGANAGSVLLPFKPQSGVIYFLTASINLPAANNWLGLGFSQSAIQGNSQSAERFTDANVKGGPWMYAYVGQSTQFYGGPEGSLPASPGVEVEPSAGTYILTIVLNTSGTNWTTSAYVNGVIEGTNVIGGTQLGTNIVYATNPTISYVGLTQQAITTPGVQWNYWALMAVPVSVPPTYTAVVNPSSVLVTNFQGWGSSLCWWANVIGGFPNRTNYVDLAFNQLKLNIVRYNIGGGENPTNHFLSYRATMQGFEPANGVWNWNADLNQRWVLQAALARGANLVDAFANSPPWWMTVSGSVTGAVGATNNLQVADETLFATYLATVVSNLTVLDGVHFDYVTPMNEPVGTKWTYGNTQEGCDMSAAQQAPVVNALRTALNNSLPTAGIDASEDVDPYQTVSSLDSYSSPTLDNIALCTTHTYSETGSSTLASKAKSVGKPLWVSEYGDNDGTGLTMAQRIHDDITGMGVRAWVYWQFVDSASGWGFLFNPLVASTNSSYTTNYTINQKFYVMGQFSEFIRPGYEIISVNDSKTLAAYNPTNSTLVLVTINTNASSFNVAYNLGDFPSAPWQIMATQTTSGESLERLLPPVVANGQFTSVIPGSSVTTFVLTTNLPSANLTISNITSTAAELSWSYGALQIATNASGPYTGLSNVAPPYTATFTNIQQFFRIKEN
jgi:O-glycosyl hydrolase